MTEREQSGLSRANYYFGGSRFKAKSDEITGQADK
jgi:hypothetical protein